MKLLVLATDPVGADDVRSACPTPTSRIPRCSSSRPPSTNRPWPSGYRTADEAIADAESAAEQTAAALRERGARARATTGESEPLVALQDALATYPADRVLVFVRDEDERALPRGRRGRRGAAALRAAGHRDRSLIVRRRVSGASWRARQRSRRRALLASMSTGRRSASIHEASSGRKGRRRDELGRRLERQLRASARCDSRARRRGRSS